jgi:uncharacterized protein (TIGR04255 family)
MNPMTGTREVYPNAPVALVTIEARHTTAAPLTAKQEAEIKTLIAEAFPLPQPIGNPTIVLPFGLATSAQGAQKPPPRFTNRDRTTAATFGPQAVVVETTKHDNFAALKRLLSLVADARQRVAPVDGLERLGLRYIDEIRVPDPDPVDWSQWVNSALLGPAGVAAPLGLIMAEHQAVARFQKSENQGLTIAYGPRQGYAVAPAPLVRSALPPPTAFFLLDVDSYWMPTEIVPEFDPGHILALCEELHEPVNALFEKLITERLRTEVLRHA